MHSAIAKYLSGIKLGELQRSKNVAVLPLFSSAPPGPEYLTLKTALERRLLVVTEVSEGGSVPELSVTNNADMPVLLLDGEELVGAKQNRVLNTSILLKEKSQTTIPVSCTEQGRWSYRSREFADSGVVMSRELRARKHGSVTDALRETRQYRADQGAIWRDVDEMSLRAQVQSPTRAMRHVFESRAQDLDELLKPFTILPHQKGLLVFLSGEVVGLDILSLDSAYETLHPKLLRSYAMDAVLGEATGRARPSTGKARDFLQEASACAESKYESIGHGHDYRYENKALLGSALLFRETVIHAAFFKASAEDSTGRMSGYRRRQVYRA